MTEPVYFTKEDVTRMWGHGVPVSIAKDTGVYLICWDEEKNTTGPLDMACGYLADGFFLDETVSNRDPRWGDIWDASRAAVGGDDFCDELGDPIPLMDESDTMLAVEVTDEEIRMWWTGPRRQEPKQDLVIGQTYTREEINEILGVSPDCECRIVEYGHVCP